MTAYKRYETSSATDFLNTTTAAKQKNTRYVLAEGAGYQTANSRGTLILDKKLDTEDVNEHQPIWKNQR